MDQERPTQGQGSYRVGTGSEWVAAQFVLGNDGLEIRPATDPANRPVPGLPLGRVAHVDELAPFGADPGTVEIGLVSGEVFQASMSREFIGRLCAVLALAGSAAGGFAVSSAAGSPRAGMAVSRRWWAVAAVAAVLAVVAVAWLQPGNDELAASQPTTPSTSAKAAGADRAEESSTTTDPSSSTTVTAAPSATAPPNTVPPDFMTLAPLTGLPALNSTLQKPAIVSKIDASPEAMPQVGLELADVIYEVKIEGSSRYLSVWHSQEPAVIGPHRSARTTDPDLLSMFGHPLFAFSGGNAAVVKTLANTPWKTGVGPGEVAAAYFRDKQRPYPHNLFAQTAVLRTRSSPQQWPTPLFAYHGAGTPVAGMPVQGFSTEPGVHAEFSWDPALGGWRRRVWNREHMHQNGSPVAPTNVVVVETAYVPSHADARSPEAISVGAGRTWVFTGGQVREGTWTRWQRTDPWNLRDAAGSPLTLDPGTTWVVLAEGQPELRH